MNPTHDQVPRLRVRTPRGVAWGITMIALAWVLLLIATAALGFGIGASSPKRYIFDLLLLVGPVLMIVGIVHARRSQRNLRQLATERDLCLCPRCHYDLRGVLGEPRAKLECPECGLHVSRDAVRQAWSEYR